MVWLLTEMGKCCDARVSRFKRNHLSQLPNPLPVQIPVLKLVVPKGEEGTQKTQILGMCNQHWIKRVELTYLHGIRMRLNSAEVCLLFSQATCKCINNASFFMPFPILQNSHMNLRSAWRGDSNCDLKCYT